ncbi:MAG: YIP1 family protein [Ktedonobacteraceae bacterium]
MELNANYNNRATTPLPLGRAMRELPSQYMKVLTRPGVQTFAEEKGKASWGSIWLQLIGLGISSAILETLGLLISPPVFSSAVSAGLSQATLLSVTMVFLAIATIVLTPVSFLVGGAIIFWIAKAFGGKGIYREQIYTTVLFGVPLVVLSYLLSLIPVAGIWLIYTPHIYSLVLLLLALKAVHRFGKVKA